MATRRVLDSTKQGVNMLFDSLSLKAVLSHWISRGWGTALDRFRKPSPPWEALVGNHHTIARILPGRPLVTTLSWTPGGYPTLPHLLAPPLSNIRFLSLGRYHPRPDLRFFHPYLQSLHVLW